MEKKGIRPEPGAIEAILREALKGQYRASMAMLRGAVESCPEDLWTGDPGAPYWRVAYHTLYFIHMYLQPNERAFVPWAGHRAGVEDLDEALAPTTLPYAREDLLTYWEACSLMAERELEAFDVLQPETGFSWHSPQRSKVEQHLSAIRHIQHHTAQLSARLRAASGAAVEWVGALPGHP